MSGAATPAPTLASADPVLAAFAEEVGDQGPVAIEGNRTRWSVGGEAEPDVRLVEAPNGIVEYKPQEMTVTVRAGTAVAELHQVLSEQGQRTGLPERGGTVGGALMVGENDVRALGRGLVRSQALQVRYVSAEGRIVSGGGPTVKNVSGFDMPRLMVGSLGTLGLLAEVIIRTNPIPPVSRWFTAVDVDPVAATDRLLAPSAVLWNGSQTWIQLEGHGPDVEAQRAELGRLGDFSEVELSDGDLPVTLPPQRWSLPPAEIPGLDGSEVGSFIAAVGLGLVFADRAQPAKPTALAVAEVAKRLKHNFDPTGRLNPGRDPGRR